MNKIYRLVILAISAISFVTIANAAPNSIHEDMNCGTSVKYPDT